MGAPAEAALLRAWEDAGSARGVACAVALAACAADADPDAVWDLPLGARDALLLTLRERLFGSVVACAVSCPGCGEDLEVEFDLAELEPAEPDPAEPGAGDLASTVRSVDVGGTTVSFRPVTSRDVLAASGAADPRRAVVLRCVLDIGGAAAPAEPAVVAAVAQRLAAADPRADQALDLTCAACGHGWRAPLDVAEQLWAELDSGARRLLHEVHRLAGAYGWREPDVLALSPARRRYYLELVDR